MSVCGRRIPTVSIAIPAPVQNYGEIFTKRWVVETLLDLTRYETTADLASLRVVEPSCGTGAFLGPIVERLLASATTHGHDPRSLSDAIRAYDLQPAHVETSRALCTTLLTNAGVATHEAREIAKTWVRLADFLLEDEVQNADIVVGNPPYIRYDDLPEHLAATYRARWPTMSGRGDIYVGFIERSLAILKPGGQMGFICADRWMRNQYGRGLRQLIASQYSVRHVWTMHDVDAFEAQVSAYPAITVLANESQGPVVVADTTSSFGESSAAALVEASRSTDVFDFNGVGVMAHTLPHWFEGDELWPTGSPARLALIELLNDSFNPLHDPATGTRVGIGIATGADKVYITKDPAIVERDRLLPLSMRRDLMSGSYNWQGNYLINPWNPDGSIVDLNSYPLMKGYLSAHPALKDRHVARRAPTSWHRTIDKVNGSITNRPKLLLQDMKATIHPVLETGGHYPHHNLYYVVSDDWDLEVLGGILLSRIAQAFIEAYCVRMRGGTLRFQAQYLKRIRVPDPASLDAELMTDLRESFRARDVEKATNAAARAYGIDPSDYELDKDNASNDT